RFARVVARHGRMGSRRSASAHFGLGEIHLMRGQREQARVAYADALGAAEATGARELAVKALGGLARAALPDDVAGPARCADAAVEQATDDVRGTALLAAGWVAAAAGERARAVGLADEAVRLARERGRRAALAEALELRSAAAALSNSIPTSSMECDVDRMRDALREAHAIWTDAGAVVHAARVALSLSRLPGAEADDRLAGLLAAQRLTELDVVVAPVRAPESGHDVSLRTRGRFEVSVGGEPVPPAAWQSRRARDLLR